MAKLKEYFYPFIVLLGSVITHLLFFGYPAETVFDEVHFGKFVTGYLTGEYFFDIHPPLGKLLITAVGYLGGFRPGADFSAIGENLANTNFIWLRLLPVIAGIFLPLVIYYLCRHLNFSKIASFTAGTLVIFESSLLVQSRFILLDSILLLFGFSGLLSYFIYLKHRGKKRGILLLILSIIFCTFAASVKWTGLSFMALIGGFELFNLINEWKNQNLKTRLKYWAIRIFLFSAIPFILYFLIFTAHFTLLKKDGPGKDFMSKSFQATLQNNRYQENPDIVRSGIWKKFTELNVRMYSSNKTLDAGHPYGSKWYTWTYMKRPIYYWNEKEIQASSSEPNETPKIAKIYLLGNPFIYWLGGSSVIFLIFYIAFQTLDKKSLFKKKRNTADFLLIGFFINLLPFIFIGRVMFLYHYFSSLIFSILILVFLIDELKSKKIKKVAVISVILISAVMFAYFSPLTYGLHTTKDELSSRFWFKTWE